MDWSAVFNDTATFYNYTLHLQKVCFSIDTSTAWLTQAVRHVDKGLKKCHDKSSKLPNFIRSRLTIRLIRSESIQSEFAHAFLMSFLCISRVPSGYLQLRRSYRGDRRREFSPHADKALVGIGSVDGQEFLAVKMSFRKNLTGGVILKLACF